MRLRDSPVGLIADEGCPLCNSRIKLTEVEPHLSHDGLEVHGFSC